jgi:hypothetical protein
MIVETGALALRFVARCLLLWLLSVSIARSQTFQEAAPDDPFADSGSGAYQEPDAPVPPQAAPCPAPNDAWIVPQPLPQPATLADLLFADGRQTPGDNRSGTFQKLSFVNTYLPRMGSDGFGWYDAELTSVWGLPFPSKDAPLVITPGIATHWLDGPAGLDIPPQLHDVYTEFRWLPKIGDRFRADIAVQPGYYSDWDGSSVRAVRILGHGSGIYDWTPTFQLVLGVAYLDRPDIELLPIAGFIWKPNPDATYQIVFPTPRISWRLLADGNNPKLYRMDDSLGGPSGPRWNWTSELWLYLGGELGGGTWAIRHSDGTSDLMSYSDWRVFAGLETKSLRTLSSHVEIGYVFHRYIRLTSTGDDDFVGNTLMARAGVNY